MKLSAPKKMVFLVSVGIAVVALLMLLDIVSFDFISAAWLALIGYAVLFLGNVLKDF
ncbi:MAG: hypothetical protein PF505_02595 [Vallitaleaceae bacterium]|jgi:hypothetical protein|nr:hypothetical protein [Vallitaleaceae bacterium]